MFASQQHRQAMDCNERGISLYCSGYLEAAMNQFLRGIRLYRHGMDHQQEQEEDHQEGFADPCAMVEELLAAQVFGMSSLGEGEDSLSSSSTHSTSSACPHRPRLSGRRTGLVLPQRQRQDDEEEDSFCLPPPLSLPGGATSSSTCCLPMVLLFNVAVAHMAAAQQESCGSTRRSSLLHKAIRMSDLALELNCNANGMFAVWMHSCLAQAYDAVGDWEQAKKHGLDMVEGLAAASASTIVSNTNHQAWMDRLVQGVAHLLYCQPLAAGAA